MAIPVLKSMRDALFLSGTVAAIGEPTPTMRRIRVQGPRLRSLTWTPGQHVRLQVAGFRDSVVRLRPRDALRTYSIHQADPDAGALDVVMFDHGRAGTPAKRWAATLSVGDDVHFTRPRGALVVRHDASHHLFVGDETASVA